MISQGLMSSIAKLKLVIGSVLRPVDDHRMYEKLGVALSQVSKYEVHIVGFRSYGLVRNKNIVFHPIFDFERMSVKRLMAPVRFLQSLIHLKPEIVIVNSPDLLIVTVLYKILFGKKIIYDVLENYQANIMFANTFWSPVRHLVASSVRLIEWLSRPFITEYWLAEQVYEKELPFVRGKFRLVENRFPLLTDVLIKPRRGHHRLLYSGTIAESYGVFDAIALVKRLYKADSRFQLTIIGFAAQLSTRKRLQAETADCAYIHVLGVNYFVSHSLIIRQIQQADIALLPYRVNNATRNRIPTKFYEYLVFSLPCIVSINPFWEKLMADYKKSIAFIDFSEDNLESIMSTIKVVNSNTIDYSLDTSYYTILFSNFTESFY